MIITRKPILPQDNHVFNKTLLWQKNLKKYLANGQVCSAQNKQVLNYQEMRRISWLDMVKVKNKLGT